MILKIYEPAMCCPTGVCGPNVDPRLVAFAGALKQVAAQGVMVERFDLAQQPQAFVADETVKTRLAELGHEKPPFIFVNDELVFAGRYPESEALFSVLGLDTGKMSTEAVGAGPIMASMPAAGDNAGGCCSDGGCC